MKKFVVIIVILISSLAYAQNPPTVSIYDIQYLPPGQDTSSYHGQTVITGGIVTAGTELFYGGSGVVFFVSDPDGGIWSGIKAYCPEQGSIPVLTVGDSILFAALVIESDCQTFLYV